MFVKCLYNIRTKKVLSGLRRLEWGIKPYNIGREHDVAGIVCRHACKEDPRLRTPTPLSPDPLSSVGCTVYLGYTLNGSGVKRETSV